MHLFRYRHIERLAGSTGLLLAVCCGAAEASVFTYNDFSDVSDLTFVTSATTYENRLRLNGTGNNNSGAVWTKVKHAVAYGFTTSYEFAIGEFTQGPGSDLLRFYVQNFAEDAIQNKSFNDPDNGTVMGANYLMVEIDTYKNPWDPNNWHLDANYMDVNGTKTDLGVVSLPGTKNSSIHRLDIEYDAVSTQLRVSYDNSLLMDLNYDLANTLDLDNGKAWIGFGAASG